MSFGFIDFIAIVILFLSGLIAAYRGFVKESLGLFAWIAAAFAGLYGYKYVSPIFDKIFKSQSLNNIISGVLVAVVVLIVLTIINSYVNKSVRGSILSGLDRTLGFLFGLLRGFLIAIVLYVVGLFSAPILTIEAEHNNIFPEYIKKSLIYTEDILPKDFVERITKLEMDAQDAYAKVLKEETKKYLEENYDAVDRKTLNDLFDAVATLDQKNDKDANESINKDKSKSQDAGHVTGTVSRDSETRKNAPKNNKAKTATQTSTTAKE